MRRPRKPRRRTKHEVDRTTPCRDMAIWISQNVRSLVGRRLSVGRWSLQDGRRSVGPQYILLLTGALNLQDRKWRTKLQNGKCRTGNWRTKVQPVKNVEHVVLMFKNHLTKLINVHDLGVSVSSSQLSILLSILRKRSPVGGDNRYKETTHARISLCHLWSGIEDTTDRT